MPAGQPSYYTAHQPDTDGQEREKESEVNECYTVVADGLYTLSIQIKITLNNLLNP